MAQETFYAETKPLTNYIHDVKKDASSEEVIQEIIATINEDSKTPFIKNAAKTLSYGNPTQSEFIKRLFDAACYLVEYEHDPVGNEIIFTSQLLIRKGKGDCKKFSTFIPAVLEAAHIPVALKVVSYQGVDWEHIYTVVPQLNGKYITLDPVNHQQFNNEVSHVTSRVYFLDGKKSKIMGNKLTKMGNLPNDSNPILKLGIVCDNVLADIDSLTKKQVQADYFQVQGVEDEQLLGLGDEQYWEKTEGIAEAMEGIGRRKKSSKSRHHRTKAERKESRGKRKARRKERRKRIFRKGKKLAFAAPRAAFLGLIKLGNLLQKTPLHFNLSHKLALAWQKDNGAGLKKIWADLGGNPTVLQKAILKGVGTNIRGLDQIEGLGSLDMDNERPMANISGIGVVTLAAVAAAITTAAPVLVVVVKHLKELGVLHGKDAENADTITAQAEELHDETGHHDAPIDKNPVVESGRAEQDNNARDKEKFTQEDPAPNLDTSTKQDGSGKANSQTPASTDTTPEEKTPDDLQKSSTDVRQKAPAFIPDETVTSASTLDFYQPFALNTWFKAVFLIGLFAAFKPHNTIAYFAANSALAILLILSVTKFFHFIKNKNKWTKHN
jgi:hypothetical protein